MKEKSLEIDDKKYRYSDVESALVKASCTDELGRPALAARVRHLRNHGILDLPKVGSGKRNFYSWRQTFTLLVALEAERTLRSIKLAVTVARFAGAQLTPTGVARGHEFLSFLNERPVQIGASEAFEQLQENNSIWIINLGGLQKKLSSIISAPMVVDYIFRERDGE